jgi:protein O-GlcNAc transferase
VLLQDQLAHAMQCHQAGRLAEAEGLYKQILAVDPRNADCLHLLGVIAQQVGRYDISVDLIEQAIAVRGNPPIFHNNLGCALKALGRLDEAAASFRRALALKPDYVASWSGLNRVFVAQGKFEEAEECCRDALDLIPDNIDLINNLGGVLIYNNKLEEALAVFERALTFAPDNPLILGNMAEALKRQGRLDESIAFSRKAIAVKPDDNNNYSNLLLIMTYAASISPQDLATTAREFDEHIADPLRRLRPLIRDKDPERRLRIGYVSPDFRDHPVTYSFEFLLKLHDRRQFEIFAYSSSVWKDHVTARLKPAFDHWRDIKALNDDQAADLIETDGIDILVDLAGHTADNRLLVFARKPAPVQVSWLGYPATTGMKAMDYRISDSYAEPVGLTEHLNVETLWRMPEIFACYQAHENSPAVIDHPPFEDNGYITFGCFNNFAKITEPVLMAWSLIMAQVPNSHLLLEFMGLESPKFRAAIEARLERLSLPMNRVILEPRKKSNQFVLYNRIDIALDPFPRNGGATSMDAVWMGVPFITLAGAHFGSRLGVTILSNAGLPELIAKALDEYVGLAVDLAQDKDWLRSLRHNLRDRVAASPLMNQQAFTRNMETAYREMWRCWCAGQKLSIA